MTFAAFCRSLALCESRALRGWARYGVPAPRCAPVDYWGEWNRRKYSNSSTFGKRTEVQ